MGKKIIVSVISDLVTDQRVGKTCKSLLEMGYDVVLVGRKSKREFSLTDRNYLIHRIPVPFKKGILMYLYFNVSLFFYLLRHKTDILWSNDLDTLLPNYFISKLKKSQLIYDSHEYFIRTVAKPFSRIIWKSAERLVFPRLKNVITVNEVISKVYEQEYKVSVAVIRNVPYKHIKRGVPVSLPEGKKVLLMQGAGINEHRGGEEAIKMMPYLPERFVLYFIGSGMVMDKLKDMTGRSSLTRRVVFIDLLPYEEMMEYTRKAYLGLIFGNVVDDQNKYILPNKLFDYIQAGLPVVSIAAVEIVKFMERFDVGKLIVDYSPEQLAETILSIEKDEVKYLQWKENTIEAAMENCWEEEEKKLRSFMDGLD